MYEDASNVKNVDVLTQELQFIASALTCFLKNHDEEFISDHLELSGRIMILNQIKKHRVLNHLVSLKGFLSCFEPSNAERIKDDVFRVKVDQFSKFNELALLNSEFEKKSIPFISFKGPLLSYSIYNDLSLRESGDIDILISQENVQTTVDLIIQLGFIWHKPKSELKSNYSTYINRYSDIEFWHPEKRILLEVHWKLFNNRYVFSNIWHELLDRSNQLRINNSIFNLMPEDTQFIYLCTHGTWHSWNRLFWLVDVATIVLLKSNDSDFWDSVRSECTNLQLERPVGCALLLMESMFNVDAPRAIADYQHIPVAQKLFKLSLDALNGGIDENGIFRKMKFVFLGNFFLKKSLKYKLSYILSLFTTHHDWEVVKLPNNLFFLYYVLRPFLWTYRHWFKG